jgi:hypothetical protein
MQLQALFVESLRNETQVLEVFVKRAIVGTYVVEVDNNKLV